MKVEKETIRKIAKLAKIRLRENEQEKFRAEFENIISFIERIGELELESVEPMARPSETELPLRPDIPKQTLAPDEALSGAPDRSGNQFRTPKVV